MSLSANVAWRIRTTGAETNGGGFDPSLTTNMLTDGAATSATGNSPVFSSASYNFVAGDVGAAVYIAAGTNWVPGWYPIASVASNQATLGAAIDATKGNAILPNGEAPLTAGCATTASPTGATWSIDYSWLGTAPKSASDLTSTASTTASSASGGLHKAMIGNILRIASGSGATTGYYAITNVASATSMTLDRASGTMTAGVFKIGGAHLHLLTYSDGGGGTAPILTSPLAAGHMIFIRGAGTVTPSSVDFDWDDGYWTFPDGDRTAGGIKIIGYNGKPLIGHGGLLGYLSPFFQLRFCAFIQTASSFVNYGIWSSIGSDSANWWRCRIDQGGIDALGVSLQHASVVECYFFNSGDATAGSWPCIDTGHVGALVKGSVINGWKFDGIWLHGRCATISDTIIVNCKGNGIRQFCDDITLYMDIVDHCTIDANYGHGLQVDASGMALTSFTNNIVSNHAQSGKKGINCADSLAVNLRVATHMFDYNCWYGNTANFGNWQAAAHDVTSDPGYTNAGSGDYTVGTNMKAIGFPATFPS